MLLLVLSTFCLTAHLSHAQQPLPHISYQGRLSESGAPVTGDFDLQFTLHEAVESRLPLATILKTNVPVESGLFTLALEFDDNVFKHGPRWLEVAVKAANTEVEFKTLAPRQLITAAPYALYAPAAGEAAQSLIALHTEPGAVDTASILDGSVTAEKIAAGQVVRSLNNLTDNVTLIAGDNVSVSAEPDGLRIAALSERQPILVSNTLWVDPVYGDDSAAIRCREDRPWRTLANALAALNDNDRLVLRPGTYDVQRLGMPRNAGDYEREHSRAALLLKGRSNVTIDGNGAVISAPGLGSVLSITDCTNVTVRNLHFIGSGANPVILSQIAGEIVLWGTNATLTFDQCRFEDFPNHAILVSQKEKSSYDTTVQNCQFRRGGTVRHAVLGPDGAAVASLGPGLKVLGCLFEEVVRGVEVEASLNSRPIGPVLIANNVMRNFWSAGVIIIPGNFTHLNDIVIADNVITGDRQVRPGAVYQIGIRASGGSRIHVSGNNVGQCANDAINLEALAPLVDVSIVNNTCWENGERSVAVLQKYSATSNVIVSGNVCLRNGGTASIEISGNNVSVSGNIIVDATGPAIRASALPGIPSRNVVILRNQITGTDTTPIAIGEGVHQTIIRDNHLISAKLAVEDLGSGTMKDQAFFDHRRSYESSPVQSLTEHAQIVPYAYNLRVSGSDNPVTLLSTPTIQRGLDGQILHILGTSDEYPVTLQDQTVLTNSHLGLGASERTLRRGDVLTLRYDEPGAVWWEVSSSEKSASAPQE